MNHIYDSYSNKDSCYNINKVPLYLIFHKIYILEPLQVTKEVGKAEPQNH